MKNKLLFLTTIAFLLIVAGCEFDNYDPPKSFLSGHVVYNNIPVGVRSNGTQLELWQYKWDTRNIIVPAKIPVYIDQDGFYSARLFDGDYKIVRLAGAPWSNPNTDTLSITVKGNTTFDVPVTPYFIITGETFVYNKSDASITSTCNITQIGTLPITNLTLYAGVTNIVDNTNNTQSNVLTEGLNDLSTPKTNKITLNSINKNRSYIFVRLGIQISGVGERYFTPVQKLSLQ